MAINRTTIVREPGVITFNSATFYSQGPITVDLVEEPFTIEADMFGPIDERVADRAVEVKFTPVGEIEALATLFPHLGLAMGASVFGATDTPLVIFTPAGQSLTIHNAAVTVMPSITASHTQTAFGEVTITGLLINSGDPTDAAGYFTNLASGATYPTDAAFSVAGIKTLGYSGAWGSSPWDAFYTQDGFNVSFDVDLQPQLADGHGTIDMKLASLDVTVTGTPIGITTAQFIAERNFQGAGNVLGAARSDGTDLIITNIGVLALYLRMYGAVMTETPLVYSGQEGPGEVTWKPTREFTAGVADPLFYVGTAAPA